eukprot:scaffold6849_cov157-Skeletonema_marinoi.AAC.14
MSPAAEDLPNDALEAIFRYLRPTESICCRGVCRKWCNTAGSGTIQIQVKRCSNNRQRHTEYQKDNIGSVTLFGRVKKKGIDDDKSEKRMTNHPTSFSGWRIRGHLPSPASQTTQDMNETATAATFGFVCDQLCDKDRTDALNSGVVATAMTTKPPCNAAVQIEDSLQFPFIAIDLSSSSSKFQYGVSENHEQTICKEKKIRSLRSSIIRLDVSCLRQLKVLSVAGCGNLKSLLLPPSVQSVDAKGCSEVLRIGFPTGCDGSLLSFDLNGCRKLRRFKQNAGTINNEANCLFAANTVTVLRNITHLDMSQLPKEGTLDEEFCTGLRSTVSLEMFSLRYCASDAVIMALAESESACGGQLCLVDIAFSTKVTDVSMKLLVRNSPALERINMRGCKGISGECYNNIPIYLERRRRGETVPEEALEVDESFSTRKGDNLFYFCKK